MQPVSIQFCGFGSVQLCNDPWHQCASPPKEMLCPLPQLLLPISSHPPALDCRVIFPGVDIPYFIYLLIHCWTFGLVPFFWEQILWICGWVLCGQVFPFLVGRPPGVGIAGSYANSVFNCLRTVSQAAPYLRSHQEGTKNAFSPSLCQHLIQWPFFIRAIPVGVQW